MITESELDFFAVLFITVIIIDFVVRCTGRSVMIENYYFFPDEDSNKRSAILIVNSSEFGSINDRNVDSFVNNGFSLITWGFVFLIFIFCLTLKQFLF